MDYLWILFAQFLEKIKAVIVYSFLTTIALIWMYVIRYLNKILM